MSPDRIDQVLAALGRREAVDVDVAVVVAHPDDETIGLGPFLRLFSRLLLVHVTDGAPRNERDARAAGFASCEAYAEARANELEAALFAGGAAARRVSISVSDQQASFRLRQITAALRDLLRTSAVVFTHAYEGGHPDHDAVAFAVHAARCPVIEMTGYHATPEGGIATGTFLPGPLETVLALSAEEAALRDQMLACFTTQRATLDPFFGANEQRFRPAPAYDFARPPAAHIYYDRFDWGIDSLQWCALARAALA